MGTNNTIKGLLVLLLVSALVIPEAKGGSVVGYSICMGSCFGLLVTGLANFTPTIAGNYVSGTLSSCAASAVCYVACSSTATMG